MVLMLHRVIITDPENNNKMADTYQPRKHTGFIERRNNNKQFFGHILIISTFFKSYNTKVIE